MSVTRVLRNRGASVLAALVFATILISMAGLMSGGMPTERVAVQQGSQNAATAAAPAAPTSATAQQSKCDPGFDYDVSFTNTKPEILKFNICSPQGAPPTTKPVPSGKSDFGFGNKSGRCDPNTGQPLAGWKCVVRDCFNQPPKTPETNAAAAASTATKEFCGYSIFDGGKSFSPQQTRVQSVAQAKQDGFISTPEQQTALLSDVGATGQKAFDSAYGDQLKSASDAANSAQADVNAATKQLDALGCNQYQMQDETSACGKAAADLKTGQVNLDAQNANIKALNELNPSLSSDTKTLTQNSNDQLAAAESRQSDAQDALDECVAKSGAAGCVAEAEALKKADAAVAGADIQNTTDAYKACVASSKTNCDTERAAAIAALDGACDETTTGKANCAAKDALIKCNQTSMSYLKCNPNAPVIPASDARCQQTPPPTGCVASQPKGPSNPNTFDQKPPVNPTGAKPAAPASPGGSQKPSGSGQQQPAQQCQTSYFCSSATAVSYRNAQCQTQIYQQCPAGATCQGTSCVQSPYGVGTDGQPCQAVQQQPAASTCTSGSWQPVRAANTCQTGWQCSTGATTGTGSATAQLSCQPTVAEPGMPVSISWSCGNAASSAGVGFSTNGLLASSTSVTIPPLSLGRSTTTIFGLSCTDAQSQVVNTQCTVQAVSPWITFVSVPSSVASGSDVTLGWITGGMKQCVTSSRDYTDFTAQNANRTSPNGSAQTPPLTRTSTFWLTCTTLSGNIKEASTTIGVFAQ